ncbi:DUF418 domain-containing protein [Georgenia sunbinii]|uniref:DUF418 domain-containing protein n=1 Tax=Georgenia sunbinii TaxID=3117728 RepID=UPI002F2632D2
MKERIIAVDIARGLAVLGMFVAHLGYAVDGVPSPSWLVVADGRPSSLFAILAGVSIALFTGGRVVPRDEALVRGYLRVATRAIAIFVIGVVLMLLETPVAVILPSYAVTFLLVMPAIAARWQLAAFFAGVVAVAGPTLVAALTVSGDDGESWLLRTLGTDEAFVLDLFVTGHYPALVWAAYMLLGLAIGRLDLRARRVQLTMAVTGLGLLLVGHGGSDLLLSAGAGDSELGYRLVSAEPHMDSTFELLGNSGVALLTLAVLLLLTTTAAIARVARALLYPIAATGAMALTAYSVHIVAIAILGVDVVWYPESNAVLVWFIVVTLVACSLWARFLGRGPLERLMRAVTVGGLPASAPPPGSHAVPGPVAAPGPAPTNPPSAPPAAADRRGEQ